MPEPTKTLTERAMKGVAWTGFAQLTAQALRLGITALLARLLLPADFGVVSMALIVIGFILVVNDFGLTAALVQRRELEEHHLLTAFTTNLVVSVLLTGLTVLTSPIVAQFFRTRAVQPILVALSAGFLLGAPGLVHQALLQRTLQFRALALAQLIAEISFGVVGVGLALAGGGVWALVGGFLSRTAVQTTLLWAFSEWRPSRLTLDTEHFRELFGFSSNVLGSQIVNYLGGNVDYLVVGRMLGDTALGYYTLAYSLTMFPRMRIVAVISRVAFPAFSAVQSDSARLRSGYGQMVKYVSIVTFPLVVGLALVAREAIGVLVGPNWYPAVRPLQILCLGALLASVGSTFGSVLKAKGRPDVELWMNLVSIGLLTGLVLIGIRYGIEGVAIAVTLKSLFLILLFAGIVMRVIDMRWSDLVAALRPATLASAVLLITLLLLRAALHRLPGVSDLAFLLAAVLVGALSYLVGLYFVAREALVTLLQMAWEYVRILPPWRRRQGQLQ
jgi:O-antigen/teichoic acid export membrane protein